MTTEEATSPAGAMTLAEGTDEPMVGLSQMRRSIDVAFAAVEAECDEDTRITISVGIALTDHLLANPAAMPAPEAAIPADVIVAAMVASWPEDQGAEWIAEALDNIDTDAADAWRALDAE